MQGAVAAVTPGPHILLTTPTTLRPSYSPAADVPKVSDRKLPLVQRLKLKVIKSRYFKALLIDKGEPTEKQKKQGKAAMILGIASIPLLFVPYVGILAIPAAIVAIVLGAKSVKGNSNTQGIVGIVTGAVSLFLLVLAIIYVAALFGR